MNELSRTVIESPLFQGINEQVAYRLSTTPWGGTPTSPTITILNNLDQDVTSDLTTGSNSISGHNITFKTIQSLTRDEVYRMLLRFTISGNVFEAICQIIGQR